MKHKTEISEKLFNMFNRVTCTLDFTQCAAAVTLRTTDFITPSLFGVANSQNKKLLKSTL